MSSELVAAHTLFEQVHVRQGIMRSVNLRRDALFAYALESYVLSAHALTSLQRLLNGIQISQRAWTLTGPYGSGKSLFALFLSALLHREHPSHPLAMTKLRRVDADLAAHVETFPGFLPVLAVGRRTSPAVCLLESIAELPSLPDDLREQIRTSLQSPPLRARTLDDLVFTSIERLAERERRPLLIILDELGKTLEYAALHPDSGDLYLLQQIAEMAPRWEAVFVGILHQAFEHYAQALEQSVRNEWAKVQGRFEDIAFVESAEQMMRLVGYAVEGDATAQPVLRGRQMCRALAEEMVTHRLSPSGMRAEEFVRLAEQVYPLHPLALVLLPHLFRHHAQNERSLFAFLTLQEPFGFQQFLHRPVSPGNPPALYDLCCLFDYVTTHFRHAVYTSVPLRPVAQVEQILLREAWGETETLVLKSLAMLQWAGEVSIVRPNLEALQCAVHPRVDQTQLQAVLQHLRQRSAIVYRSFNGTYRVWQGSDVDVEERLQEARRQVGHQVNLADLLNRLVPPLPLVARRHSYQTGTLRAFEMRYLDDRILSHLPQSVASPTSDSFAGTIYLCLPRHGSQVEQFEAWARSPEMSQQMQAVIGVPLREVRLHESLIELACLEWVQHHTPALRDDPVARRELRERTDLVTAAIREQVQQALHSCRWFYRGEEWTEKAQRSLSSLLSEVCDRLYTHTPLLHNELINRWTLSSAAAAGRRNLIQAMLEHPGEERLGITGYPPERSMYESVLHATGLHAPDGLGWRFVPPPTGHPRRLYLVWERMYARIFTQPPERVNVAELLQELVRPPYGITPGVFPVILCAFLQVYADETSLYREGTFLPEPGIADWEVLLRRPELFAVAGCRTEGTKAEMLQQIAQRWNVAPKTVPVVRELVRRIRLLPDHAKRTKRLSSTALALRQAVLQAYSPERLLYHDVPSALGVPVEKAERFADALISTLQELQEATPHVIRWARDELLKACGLPEGDEGWKAFRQQATDLRDKGVNPHLMPLLLRAAYTSTAGTETSKEEAALESVLALVGGKPPRAWTDVEVERFPESARTYGELFQQAVRLAAQEVALTPEETALRDNLLEQMRRLLSGNLPARVRLSALLRLLQEQSQEG
ncbi:MAG: hypothetical protein KatS3mg022_2951 [Armatimonadota bacterium]|nr:MAG: hypothetical protein KatS3mg022_2951 [Armatimonadota bacterium]